MTSHDEYKKLRRALQDVDPLCFNNFEDILNEMFEHGIRVGPIQAPEGWKLMPKVPTEAMLNASGPDCHQGRMYPQDNVVGPRAQRAHEYACMYENAPMPPVMEHRGDTEGEYFGHPLDDGLPTPGKSDE